MIAWAKDVSASLKGNQSEDFLIGDQLVSVATEAQLSWVLSVARVRHEFLPYVESLINGTLAVPENVDSIFAKSSSESERPHEPEGNAD